MGAKAGQRGKPQGDRAAGRQRLALILFGVLFVLLFVVFAVADGLGAPSVPSGNVALVESVPEEVGHISQKDFERALVQQIAQAKLKKAPEAGSDKYEELKEAALGELLDQAWIQGQAEELDISVTDKQVEDELATIKKQSFGTEKKFEKFLEESKFNQEDVNDRVRLQLLSTQIQEKVSKEAPQPSSAEIEAYYEAEKEAQFTTPESRDIRLILNKEKQKILAAQKEIEADNSAENWKKVAAKYSSDPTSKSKGGLQEGITKELLQEPLKVAVFNTATGELTGSVKYQTNYVLIEVVKLHPEKVQSLGEVKSQIESTLAQETQQTFFSEFVADYQTKWEARTFCAEGYVIERCSNFKGNGHPKNASPSCYEANPKTPPTECPSPVTPISPALPGSVTEAKPKGEPFPQRPRPEASEEAAGGATELPEGVPPPTGE